MGLPEPDRTDVFDARNGDAAAFGKLVHLYQDWVFRLAFRMVWDADEARDLGQEVFLRLFRSLDRYDPERPFGPWFFRLASNVCLNGLKKKKRAPVTFQVLEHEGADIEPAWEGPGTFESASTFFAGAGF